MEWIDRDVFAQLGRDTDESLLPTLVQIFVEDGESSMQAMAQALANRDREGLCLLAHTLKSVCATYGAGVCQEQASRLEQACRQDDWPSIEAVIFQLQSTLPSTIAELRTLAAEVLSQSS